MKTLIGILLCMALILNLAACGTGRSQNGISDSSAESGREDTDISQLQEEEPAEGAVSETDSEPAESVQETVAPVGQNARVLTAYFSVWIYARMDTGIRRMAGRGICRGVKKQSFNVGMQ